MVRATRSSTARASLSGMTEPQQLSSPPATPNAGQKRGRKSIKQEDNAIGEKLHNLETANPTPGAEDDEHPPPRKRAKRSNTKRQTTTKAENDSGETKVKLENMSPLKKPKSSPKKTPKKTNNYGLTPGLSPYPNYAHPTPEECRIVKTLLEKTHGKIQQKKEIPPPSLQVAGCGEVPSVIDALVRTRLSANTTNKNSSTAFQGLVKRFGVLTEGVGKGSVDWDAVRRAPQREVYKAIERGGLADRKSKDIQAILQMAYEENQARSEALGKSDQPDPAGANNESQTEKKDEIARAKQNVLSLDHIHLLSTPEAIEKMLTYPGIGPKTASCVALFCLQRPSFAVDTHVFRLCQYLKWVPSPSQVKKGEPKVDRNTTYSHCDARIPDEFKYALHYLFVKHGKVCPRCRAITGSASKGWEDGCPIEHLVTRHGAKKGGVSAVQRKKAKAAAEESDSDEEEWEGED
ncbi:putative DNA glycosylase [Acrodontium crateriforme]|uniref:DNA glycosylase n=1 Tax=Acrodontium crateriforme TaxID=150365 RepID=A0AAQ3LZ87_9PEZI|nr:putative DNA glycosylase [Acrodontium crateriforme]